MSPAPATSSAAPAGCLICGKVLEQPARGRQRLTCSSAHRQELYRRRRRRRRGGDESSDRDG